MRNRLPLSDTTVSVNKSLAEIMDLLESAEFEKRGQMNSGNEYVVVAVYKGLPFTWKINRTEVKNALIAGLSEKTQREIKYGSPRGLATLNKITEATDRVAWRLLAAYVKAGVMAVMYGVADVPDIFAGFLTMNTGGTLGNQIKQSAADGTLQLPKIMGLLE